MEGSRAVPLCRACVILAMLATSLAAQAVDSKSASGEMKSRDGQSELRRADSDAVTPAAERVRASTAGEAGADVRVDPQVTDTKTPSTRSSSQPPSPVISSARSGPVHARIGDGGAVNSNGSSSVSLWITDVGTMWSAPVVASRGDNRVATAQFQSPLLPTPQQQAQVGQPGTPSATTGTQLASTFGTLGRGASLLSPRRRQLARGPASVVAQSESSTRPTSDAGSLLRLSPSGLGVQSPKRNPIVTDTRVRGSRVGVLGANGSYWVPARMDLDTMLSKIDSRIVQDIVVIKGPFSSRHGPGFDFVDVELLPAPRYEDRFQLHGNSLVEYKTNGEQWYGRQTVLGGDETSGFRVGYGHRAGNDYTTGDGVGIPSSYKSRDLDFAYGINLSADSQLEFNYLRLDQTDLELPGQAFDINTLVTDGFDMQYTLQNADRFDVFELTAWYNRTEFDGDARRPGKRRQFPFYDAIDFVGVTDVDSMSTGYQAAWTWECDEAWQLTAGSDLRYVKQELNEITSGEIGFNFWENRNSPIPRSHHSNPGLFLEYTESPTSNLVVTSGARVDWVSANLDEDPNNLTDVGIRTPFDNPLTFGQIVGGSDFDRDFALVSVFATTEYRPSRAWTATLSGGYAERPPTLTELYAAQTFMFLLQSGLNSVTGDPELDKERAWQVDASLAYDSGRLRGGLSGFHAWLHDYITFENLRVFPPPPAPLEQVNLKFVNTDLATMVGGEFYTEYDVHAWLTGFATVNYVSGRDHTRNGDFATQRAQFNSTIPSVPSEQVPGQPRGVFSNVPGASEEPLPSISPLEARLGLRIHEAASNPAWSVELSARIVDAQDQVATSLLETTTPGFTVWDVRGFWQATERMLVVAGVENFTDKNYREYLDFRPQNQGALTVFQPGVNFYFGSELTY